MFWEKFLNFLKGYVEFFASGGFPERFINLCSLNKIEIKNIKMQGETITGVSSVKGYSKIRKIAKKSGMRVRLKGKHGLPFFIHRNRNRVGIIFGFVFMIIMTWFLSDRIWVISVKGNETIPSESLASAFSELGVSVGVKKDSLNVKEIARKALTEVDGIMWNAVNIDGCRVTIEVKEQVRKEILPEGDEIPSNIVASNSGRITLIESFVGSPVVSVGSAVEKGDIIVSGAVINKDESVSFYKAEANVFAETKNTVVSEQFPVREMRDYGRVKKKIFISFFGFCFPINFVFVPKENFDFSSTEDFISASGEKLPVGVIEEKYASYEKRKVKLTPVATKLMCAEDYFRQIDENFDEIEILKTVSRKSFKENFASITSVFQCVENIGVSREMDLTLT